VSQAGSAGRSIIKSSTVPPAVVEQQRVAHLGRLQSLDVPDNQRLDQRRDGLVIALRIARPSA